MGRLDGKVALISGGSRGQGAAEGRLFVAEGARVMLADVLDEPGEVLAKELGDAAIYQHLDVRSEEQWEQAVARCVEEFGRLDILVNNAGIVQAIPMEKMPLSAYMEVVEINQVGVFLGMRTVTPAMRTAGGGSIVNISSNAGLEGVSGVIGYVASKWAVRGMTKTAALELGHYGIRVNSVHPGGVDTPMLQQDDFESVDQNKVFRTQPIPRIGQPEEIANLVLFLASDESSFSTGSEFVADGGLMAGRAGAGVRPD
ncbi:glucose 1-dehydrogenase [Myxococcota bacterium]|nr:glucose 1-dehydrogenase [Myxococcota bacterium]